MKSHQSTQTKAKKWPTYICQVNIFTNESVVLKFFGEQANGKATYREPIHGGKMHSNIPHSVANATKHEVDSNE